MQELSQTKEREREMKVKDVLQKVRISVERSKKLQKEQYKAVETHNGGESALSETKD